MAYNTQYQSIFRNELEQDVTINILQKDGAVVTPQPFVIREMELNDSSDENTIIARELTFTIWADDDTPITWETFLAGSYDEWKATVDIDGQSYFAGFLTPEEGNAAFLPKPYDIKLRATNGVKLLKDVALTDLDGEAFHGKYTAIDFIAACLQKTLLELPFRTYGSIYNEDMDDRDDDPAADYLAQIMFDHRSFMKDATTFMSCYDVLVALLGRHSRLFFWNGIWVIIYIPELQFKPGGLWYSNYDNEGVVIDGGQEAEDVSAVGTQELIYPQDEDQIVSSSFPIKFSKTVYNYNVWQEIPLNNKFQRGILMGTGIDSDGNAYKDYSIEDWTSGVYVGSAAERSNLPNYAVPNPDTWVRRSTFNQYGIELKREVVINRGTVAGARFVQSEGIPVNQGDKAKFSFDWRASVDLGEGDPVPVQLVCYIIDDLTGNKYALRSKDGQLTEVKWEPAGTSMIGVYTTPNGDLLEYQSISIETPSFPVNGTLYIVLLISAQLGDNTITYYKGFGMEYIPYVAGGYIPIKGDYWQHTQDENQLDVDEGEMKTSDTITRVLQGCMFNNDGLTATTPTWYRYGLTESRHFKELVNIGRYNLGYRRFWRVEGSYTGLQYSTVADPLVQKPISYHKAYRYTDLDGLSTVRDFILTPPLRMDLCTGVIKAVFEEVYKPGTINIGARLDTVMNGIIALINTTTEAEWDGAGNAPSPGTPGFPPTIDFYRSNPLMFEMIVNTGEDVAASANANGAGNAPSLTVNTQTDGGGVRTVLLTIGDDIAIGNIFSIEIYGVTRSYTVVDLLVQADGNQLGDSQVFNYIFSN